MNQPVSNQKLPEADQETYGYSAELQRKIVAMILYDPRIISESLEVIRSQYFDNPILQDLVTILLRYIEKYQRLIPTDVFIQETSDLLAKQPNLPASMYWDMVESVISLGVEGDFDYVRDRVLDFAKYQEVKQAIIDSVDLLQKKRDYTGILQRITKAMAIGSKPEEDYEELHSVCMADVEEKEVSWLLKNRIAYDELTIWGGDPGGGKSYLSMWLAAHISAGIPWEMDPTVPECGSVLILNTEDDPETEIHKRLRTNGADMAKCHVIDSVTRKDKTGERLFSLTRDLNKLKKEMDKFGDVRLVIIDLLDTYLGAAVDSHKGTDISIVVAPLKRFATQNHIAILGLMHLNKNEQSSFLYRLLGSVKFVGIPRVVEFITKDKKDFRIRYFHIAKLNHDIVEDWDDLKFAFHKEPDGRIMIDLETDVPPIETQIGPVTKEDLREGRKKKDEAVAILRELFEHDTAPEVVPAAEVISAHPDIYLTAWGKARNEVGVKSFQKDGVHWWKLKKRFISEKP